MPAMAWRHCSACLGEGYLLSCGAPGEHAAAADAFVPSEGVHPCPACHGRGEVEVCASCLEPLRVEQGREVCGCLRWRWPQAA